MILGVHSFKGGSGKTFVSTNLAYKLAEKGRKVCIIELDMKAPSLNFYFGGDRFVNELLMKKKSAVDYLINVRRNLDVVVASPYIKDIKRDITRSDVESLRVLNRLKEVLSELPHDIVILDNSPGLSYMSVNSMLVSDIILFVSRAEKDDVKGLEILFEISKNVDKPKYVVLNRVVKGVEIEYPVIAKIPCSCDVSDEPFFVERYRDHEISKAFDVLAETVLHLL